MTPTELVASLPESRRDDVRTLHKLIRRAAPSLKPRVDGSGIAYGNFHYRYPSGREGDSPVVAVASLKQAISLYVMATRGTQWLPEIYADRIGKANCGKSCIRIRRVADVHLDVIAEMVREAAALHAGGRPQPRLTHEEHPRRRTTRQA